MAAATKTWKQMADQAKKRHGVTSDDTTYDDDILDAINMDILPELRGILLEKEDAGWLESIDEDLDLTAGERTYTPTEPWDRLRGVFIRGSASDTLYYPVDRVDQLRRKRFETGTNAGGQVFGYFVRNNSIILSNPPSATIANGMKVFAVPEVTVLSVLATAIADIPYQFYPAALSCLDLLIAELQGSENLIVLKTKRRDRALEQMSIQAASRIAQESLAYDQAVSGSGGFAWLK